MLLLTPSAFPDYELLDCGDFEKLERFGKFFLIRPEPQAVWQKKLSPREWEKIPHAKFIQRTSHSGEWKKMKPMPDKWQMEYEVKSEKLKIKNNLSFKLALTSFKHVGIFPEQAVNWDYIYETLASLSLIPSVKEKGMKFLNLFAYTGAASLAAKAAGADVTHLDSVKQVIARARENMELNGMKDIRWVVEDALKFVKREVKRKKKYHGIILDPPAYGIGAGGEKWKLEDHIQGMMNGVLQLLDEKEHFLILNIYSLGFSALVIENLLKDFCGNTLETGELFLLSSTQQKLPLGVVGRVRK